MSDINIHSLRQGSRRLLAKAITLIESTREDDRVAAQQLINSILMHAGKSIRIGVSGVPGVGKSTFIESFGLFLANQGKKVAVLAVDPSSPIAGGSILGDKTRMEMLSRHENAFIRPSPSLGALGGVAQKTRETVMLCEAAGYDVIIVETIGVGQSEYDVASIVDFFLLLMMPNAGDELQGIKKGIMELVDALVINKADGESVELAKQSCHDYRNALHLLDNTQYWNPEVLMCSALLNEGISEVWEMIERYVTTMQDNGQFENGRAKQNLAWMKRLIYDAIDHHIHSNSSLSIEKAKLEHAVKEGTVTPLGAANAIIEKMKLV